MPSFKGFGGILGSFQNLIFAHSLLFFRGCQTCGEGDPRTGVCRFPGRPKNGSLQVSRKAKDGSLKPFHVHAHTEFAFVLNSADL